MKAIKKQSSFDKEHPHLTAKEISLQAAYKDPTKQLFFVLAILINTLNKTRLLKFCLV